MTTLLAEFATPEALLAAARRGRAAGLRIDDAFSPFPVAGLDQALGLADQRINRLGFAGLVAGGLTGWLVQWYANVDYPLDIGGKPVIAPPAFTVLTFEVAVLGGALCLFLGLLILNRLPRLHHPLFEVLTGEGYFLLIDAPDNAARRLVEDLRPLSIAEVAP